MATHPGVPELPGSLRTLSQADHRHQRRGPVGRPRERSEPARGGRVSRAAVPAPNPGTARVAVPPSLWEQSPGRQLRRALPLRLRNRAAARRLWGERPMETPLAGWLHGPPTSEQPPAGVAGSALRSLLLQAPSSRLAGALYRAHTHLPHTHAGEGGRERGRKGGRAERGRPTCDTSPSCPLQLGLEKHHAFIPQMCTGRPVGARHGKIVRNETDFFKSLALVKPAF